MRSAIIFLVMLCGPIAFLNVEQYYWFSNYYGFLLPLGNIHFHEGFLLFFPGERILIICAEIRVLTTLFLIGILNFHRSKKIESEIALFIIIYLAIVQTLVPFWLLSWEFHFYVGYFIPLPTQAIIALILVLLKRRKDVTDEQE